MAIVWLITFGVGILSVLQGGLNRVMAQPFGLPLAVVVNASCFLIGSLIYLWFQRHTLPSSLNWNWWYVFPGLMGFLFVLGVPFAIARLGAVPVFVTLVAAQMLGSVIWDIFMEPINVAPARLVGTALALSGSLVIWWKG